MSYDEQVRVLVEPLRAYLNDLDGFQGNDGGLIDDVIDYPSGGSDTAPLLLADLRALVAHVFPPEAG